MIQSAPGQSVLEAGSRRTEARTLVQVLAETARDNPDAVALEDPDGAISYRRLLRLVNEQARALRLAGVRRGDAVGIRIPSGTRDLYLSILATLVVGAAYVPVDADDPEERARLVFQEAAVVGVIGAGGVFEPIGGAIGTRGAVADGEPTAQAPRPEDDAWVIFTSGSTGLPKGVAVTHRSAAAFVDAEARLISAG